MSSLATLPYPTWYQSAALEVQASPLARTPPALEEASWTTTSWRSGTLETSAARARWTAPYAFLRSAAETAVRPLLKPASTAGSQSWVAFRPDPPLASDGIWPHMNWAEKPSGSPQPTESLEMARSKAWVARTPRTW